jgi:ferredoxin
MRIDVDLDLCQGHGVCESEAPDVFRVSKETNQVEVLDTNPPEDLRTNVLEAVKNCPTQALTLVED